MIALTVAEAIEACIEYAEENCVFSPEKRAFVYTKSGWGSPRVIYAALHDPLPVAGEPTPRIENHSYRGKPYAFKLQQFRDAVASGALKVEGRKLPIKEVRHVRLDPVEAAHLVYNPASNSGQYGEVEYGDLRFYPDEYAPEHARTGPGKTATQGRERVKVLHAANQHRIKPGMTQAAYARILREVARKQREDMAGLSLKSVQRHLKYHGVLTKRVRQKT